MQQNLADPTFGLDRHAWTILNLLSTMEPDFAEFDDGAKMYDVCIQTSVYVNGTSRWVALTLYPQLWPKGISKVILIGEDPMTDDILVEEWNPSLRDTAPSPLDSHAHEGHRFGRDEIAEAGDFIKAELASAYRSMRTIRGVLQTLGV